jgi:hypothetical protein
MVQLALTTLVVVVFGIWDIQSDQRLQPYLDVLEKQGSKPVPFVAEKLEHYDLIIFDDALHTAVEPFDFYQQLISDPSIQQKKPAIFLEVVSSSKQRHLDAYLAAQEDNPQLLYPAFQDDLNGFGFPYKIYFDLLKAIHSANRTLNADQKFKVYGVGSPTYWSEIQTPRDFEQFSKSLAGYDHHMYVSILNELDQFKSHRKGFFLTNTRHAYKAIKHKNGQLYWNTATFFTQWHPGKSYSVRVHNVSLFISGVKAGEKLKTGEGLERIEYKFVRMAKGLWDSAFRAFGDTPVAIPLEGNVFGEEPYIGNHQLDVPPDQKMQDAYDAVVFLAPLEKLRETALIDSIYTSAFKDELKRRLGIIYSEKQLQELCKKSQTKDLESHIAKNFLARPEQPASLVKTVGAIDEWKTNVKK